MNEKIRQLRLARKMTLEDVGNIVGVGKSTVRKWESGDIANMRRDKIAKLAVALGVSPAYLMGWEDVPDTTTPQNNPPSNTIRIAGRDGSFTERKLTDDQIELIRRLVDQMPDYED